MLKTYQEKGDMIMSQGPSSHFQSFTVDRKNAQMVADHLKNFIGSRKYTYIQFEMVRAVSTEEEKNLFGELSRQLSDEEERSLSPDSIKLIEIKEVYLFITKKKTLNISITDSVDTWLIYPGSEVKFYQKEVHIEYFLKGGKYGKRTLFRDRVVLKP